MNLHRFLSGKVVLITGSSRGIGRETARLVLEHGARVVVHGRNLAGAEVTRAALGIPERTMALSADLTAPGQAQTLVDAILAAWGRLDLLINNAGLSMRGSFSELSPATVTAVIDANLLTAIAATQAALPALRASRGRIVFISSLAAIRGFPGVSLYSAAKMALTALHQSLRAEERGNGIASTVVYLAFTENDAEKTILGADGQPFHHQRRWTMTQGQAARAILQATARGKREIALSAAGKVLLKAQAWVPGLVDRFVRASGGTLHSVEKRS